jgi:hypothetical protein
MAPHTRFLTVPEVVDSHRLGITLWPILPTIVLEITDQFVLLRVDRDRGLVFCQCLLHFGIDVAELSVPVGMADALRGLAISLQAEPAILEEFAHQRMADLVTLGLKRRREPAQALARPAQRRLRIAARRRLDQSLQIRNQRDILRHCRLTSTAQTANTPRQQILAAGQFLQPAADRARRHTGCRRHRSDPAIASRDSLGGGNQPTATLIQERRNRFKPLTDRKYVNHNYKIRYSQSFGNPLQPNCKPDSLIPLRALRRVGPEPTAQFLAIRIRDNKSVGRQRDVPEPHAVEGFPARSNDLIQIGEEAAFNFDRLVFVLPRHPSDGEHSKPSVLVAAGSRTLA